MISFSRNGVDMGPAFKIAKKEVSKYVKENQKKNNSPNKDLEDQKNSFESNYVFYPHVLSKNYVFEMNFGQRVSFIGGLNSKFLKQIFIKR